MGLSWFPDNRSVTLAWAAQGLRERHLFKADTGSGAMFPISTETQAQTFPAVSPDGKRIAFVSGELDADLADVPLDGSPARMLLATSRNESQPAWSPNGRQFAYQTDAHGATEIWLRDIAEKIPRLLVPEGAEGRAPGAEVRNPGFAPDGQRLSFEVLAPSHAILVAPFAGGRPVSIDNDSADRHFASWSPDGDWIAYERTIDDKWELAKVPSGGGGKPVSLGACPLGFVRWSPSGTWILCGSQEELHLVSPDGKVNRLLRTSLMANVGFSADGSTIYAIRRNRDRKWEVAHLAVPSGAETKVVLLGLLPSVIIDRYSCFSLHPDGKRFATTVSTRRSDIWMME